MRLAGRTVAITGAGSGMGRAMVELFAAEGANVVASDVNRMVDEALSRFGAVDVLVNNAGIMDRMLPADEVDDEVWERVLGVNLTGPFLACRRVLPHMVERGKGVIINIASIGGLEGGRAGRLHGVQARPGRTYEEHSLGLPGEGHSVRGHLPRRRGDGYRRRRRAEPGRHGPRAESHGHHAADWESGGDRQGGAVPGFR